MGVVAGPGAASSVVQLRAMPPGKGSGLVGSGAGPQSSDGGSSSSSSSRIAPNLDAALKRIVHIHGVQLLLDGVYNADPHPGNVIVQADGTLGLIDYGMVGRLSLEDRLQVAQVVVALAERDVAGVARLYAEAGYDATTYTQKPHNAAIVHRIATFHLDRIDLSRVDTGEGGLQPIIAVLQNTLEHQVPDWVEQSRRLGGLLIGVANQSGRPISLAKEWAPTARQLLQKHKGEVEALAARRKAQALAKQ
jgi:aarF domain-containing kinase